MQINWFRSFTLYFLAKKIRNNIQTPFITFLIDHFTNRNHQKSKWLGSYLFIDVVKKNTISNVLNLYRMNS